jgi:hypothetical protein
VTLSVELTLDLLDALHAEVVTVHTSGLGFQPVVTLLAA